MANDDYRSEAELFEEEALARRALEESSRAAAEVIMDLEERGALYSYIIDTRDEAAAAMVSLVKADPSDTKKIIELQRIALLYLDAVDWLHRRLKDGEEVEMHIKEEFGEEDDQPKRRR